MSALFTVITLFALEGPLSDSGIDPASRWRDASERHSEQHRLEMQSPGPDVTLGGLLNFFSAAGSQMPVRLAHQKLLPESVFLAPESGREGPFGEYNIIDGMLSLYGTQTGGVLALKLRTNAQRVGQIAQLLRDTAFRKDKVTIAGTPLIEHAHSLAQPIGIDIDISTTVLGQVHQTVTADTFEDLLRLDQNGKDADAEQSWRSAQSLAAHLTSKNPTRTLRSRLTNVKYPPEANSHVGVFTAITSHTTIIAGHDYGFVNGALLSAIQCLSAITQARYLRGIAYRAVSEVRPARSGDAANATTMRSRLLELAADVSSLKLEQSFALRAYIDIAVLIPDERLAAYHRILGGGAPLGASFRVGG